MLSALSVAEFCRTEAARLAAISRFRASCRCLSESEPLSRLSCDLDLAGFFGTGGGGFFSSFRETVRKNPHLIQMCAAGCWLSPGGALPKGLRWCRGEQLCSQTPLKSTALFLQGTILHFTESQNVLHGKGPTIIMESQNSLGWKIILHHLLSWQGCLPLDPVQPGLGHFLGWKSTLQGLMTHNHDHQVQPLHGHL